ncbi:RHS repeat domain-containing protein [Streptacidiphilus anmyonensis]|uniref:RHS repeat domain-containing protein n=1 Tax=Streptacidiphilus anmyonensis TaxID=405782 RepID=UPI00069509AC|nr:RHS repeat-associated core domain-containing protein [Streptacidiphilus anmyonensis]
MAATVLVAITPAASAASATVKLGPAQAADEASAALAARLQNRRIEVLNDRTDASQTFANPDGTFSYEASAQPERVKQAGVWKDLDATLAQGKDGSWSPAVSESPLVLSGGGSGALATMTVDGKQLSLTWPSALPTPTASGSTLTYANVLPSGVDLQVTATPAGGVEETLVIKNATAAADPALADLQQSVSASNGTVVSTDAGGNLTDTASGGGLLVNAPAPVMWDSATTTDVTTAPSDSPSPAASSTTSAGGTQAAAGLKVALASLKHPATKSTARVAGSHAHQARVKASFKDHKLHLVADKSLLTAKSTVFPVFEDPAFVPHPASGSTLHWDEVQQAYPTTSNYDAAPGTGLAVGYQGFSSPTGVERTYYNVSIPSSIWGAKVLSATMNTAETYSASCGSTAYSVQAWSTNTINSGTDWNNAPAKVTEQSATNFGPACNGNVSGSFNFLNQVTNAANGKWANITWVLVNSSETDDTQLKRFADNPTLSITYDTPPATPTGFSASPTATAGYTSSHTPTLSASATDANSDTVRLDYQILSGATVLASGSSGFVNPGTVGTWADTTSLADGSYTWQVRAYDGSQYSAWSAAQPLTVDTTAPANSSVSSTDFPANTWSGTPDANGNFTGSFTITPPSSDVAEVAWELDSGAWNYTPTTGAAFTKSLTFPAGKHDLVVKTHDAAGNLASGYYYYFYAGSGAALTAPAAGERPARRVGLMAQGQTSYTGVTYQYRLGETDTWHNVPVANVTKNSDGSTLTAWPVPVTGGAPAALTWNITDTLSQDGPVDVRAYFTDGTNSAGSPATTITVDRNAGTAPTVQAGPASVNSLTGDATLSATDASAFGLTVSRTASSRRPTLGSSQSGQAAIFGPQWSSGTTAEVTQSDWSYITQTSSTAVSLVDVDGNPTGFTATSAGGWKPEPGAEDLTLTGSLTGSFTLKGTDGTTTVFTKPSGASTWQVTSTYLPTSNSTTTVVPQTVTVNGSTLVRPQYVIAPTSAATAATCQTTPSTKGCRMLEYDYAATTTATASTVGNYAGQVQQIKLWATAPGASSATATVIAQYDYDNNGQLRDEWDPRVSPALKTSYGYDSAGRITSETDPGELPWTFTYGQVGTSAVAGPGMLLSASRPTLVQGSNTQTDGGTAATTVVYNVPLTGSSAPNAMGPTDVAAWNQSDAPTDATAVFPPDQVPASSDGSTLGAGDYTRATITYTDASGREVNTATTGGRITTTGYDAYGNTVFSLTATNRQLATSSSAWAVTQRQSLGIDNLSTSDRAAQLATVSVYNDSPVATDAGTDKNTDPATAGQRMLEEYGPLHQVNLAGTLKAATGGTDLPAGSVVSAREHTVNTYDEGRPTDGTANAANNITTTVVGAFVAGYPGDGDVRTRATGYDWAKGLVTKTVTDPAGLAITRTTGYDSQGRVISSTMPKSNGSDAGTTVTTYWSATGTGACQGRPEWADLVCSVGPASSITGGGSNPSQLATKTTTYDQWGNPATVTDTANGVTRTTTNTYDSAGRLTLVSVTGGTGTAVADTSTTYDPATGKKATVTAGGKTITYTYDALGRQTQYTDGNGGGANTSYDSNDRPVTISYANSTTKTYTYDTTGEIASTVDSVAGTTTADYDYDGQMYAEHLPGGITLTILRDQTGQITGRVYNRDSDGTEVTSDIGHYSIQGQELTHTDDAGLNADQAYTYDAAGRLTNTDDTEGTTTTHRAYSYDANSNRTGLTTTVDNPDGSAGTPVATAYTYDSADRLQTLGGTAVNYDAFGRTTNQADGSTLAYYTNDLVQQETAGTSRQTWNLDPAGRLAWWTTETNNGGTWTQTGLGTNHYADDSDSPDWTVEDTAGDITRNVQGIDGDLVATTDATGNTVLQLTNVHGDVTVQYPLDTTKNPTVQANDEFGNPIDNTAASRYGWLGGKEKSSQTPSGLTLMGVRLYNPQTGRFLQIDPIPGGSANAYDYADADPINRFDLDGRCWDGFGWFCSAWHSYVHFETWYWGSAWYYSTWFDRWVWHWAISYAHKRKSQSTGKAKLPKHEKGERRTGRDQGGEKGDARRTGNPNKRNGRGGGRFVL